MIAAFSLRERPFSWPRFLLFMTVLAGLALWSVLPEDLGTVNGRADPTRPGPQAGEVETRFDLRYFEWSANEMRSLTRQVGLPWFLRRLGATAAYNVTAGDMTIEVIVEGRTLGHYVERLVALDDDHSKLFIGFVATEPELLRNLVAPMKEFKRAPVDLMRVAMMEHTRSAIELEDFNLGVLEGNRGGFMSFARFVNFLLPQPKEGEFRVKDAAGANIRRAYREEARRAGDLAPRL